MGNEIEKHLSSLPNDLLELRAKLLGSLYEFIRYFYYVIKGSEFSLTSPTGRESHVVTILRALTDVFYGRIKNLIINTPPRSGKTTMVSYFQAWALAHYGDSNFIYISYGEPISLMASDILTPIIKHPIYQRLFGIRILSDHDKKSDFSVNYGGRLYFTGSLGPITGVGAGIKGKDRFAGCVIMDDMHKTSEAASDKVRDSVIQNFSETIISRRNDTLNTPMIYIGQRVHECDLAQKLIDTGKWDTIKVQAIDSAGNSFDPKSFPIEELLSMKEYMSYTFEAQYQQEPVPSGGALFKEKWFKILNSEPEIISTFITVDTAESAKTISDKTVFSFWGTYKINCDGVETEEIGLLWLDCVELQIEPKDLKDQFWSFYVQCNRYKVKPEFAAIEKKSSGVTLISILSEYQGINVVDIERTRSSGSKLDRFIQAQPFISRKFVSFLSGAHHYRMCVDHMCKITANGAHRWDDIADTLTDAITLVYVDKIVGRRKNNFSFSNIIESINDTLNLNIRSKKNLNRSFMDYN